MDGWDKLCMTLGYLLLALGVGSYMMLAFTGKGSVLLSFFGCMSCLFFFNWPTVRARKRARKKMQAQPENMQEELDD